MGLNTAGCLSFFLWICVQKGQSSLVILFMCFLEKKTKNKY